MSALPPSDPSIADFAYHSSDEILAHSRFPAARAAFVDALLGLYEGDAFLNRLLLEAGRMVIFTNINCLHAGYDKADRATWPTMRLLQEVTTPFGVASPRRIEDLVARLIHCGPSRIDRVAAGPPFPHSDANHQDVVAGSGLAVRAIISHYT